MIKIKNEIQVHSNYVLDKKFAIKIISLALRNPSQAMVLRDSIINEIAMAKRLSKANDHIVKMYGFDFHEKTGLGFIIMELGKEDLETALQRYGRLPPKERKFVWRQLVSIAMILHNHSIVIRSIVSFCRVLS